MERAISSQTHSDPQPQLQGQQPDAIAPSPAHDPTTSATQTASVPPSTAAVDQQIQQPTNGDDPQSRPQPTPPHPEAAPSTTLWENFMASFRNVVNRTSSHSAQTAHQPTATHTVEPLSSPVPGAPPDTSQPSDAAADERARAQIDTTSTPAATPTESGTAQMQASTDPLAGSSTTSSGLPRSPVFFRLPFAGPDGNPALLAFHPQPLPNRDSAARSGQNQSDSQPSPTTSPTQRPEADTSANATSHSHPHADGHVPISPLFVPFGASPLPFSFIYDVNTQTAWPIAQVTPGSPPGGPSPDAPESQQPRLVAGPPFRIILDIHFAAPPEPEQPDAEKAAKYVKQLERADAELRARMARLGMGSIGGFGDTVATDDQDALLGCGVCLDNYQAEDRPEWIDGPKSHDEAVVAVPCHGHHTLHAGCLRDWLAKLPPSQWTCPFCRASLNPGSTLRPTQRSSGADTGATSQTSPKATSSAPAQVHTTLREEVRARERQRGWRCDAPACLPRYPVSLRADDGHLDLPETSDDMTTDLVKLTPCRHEVHLDCLCTSMRVENDLTAANALDSIMGRDRGLSSEEAADSTERVAAADADTSEDEQRNTVGKWVTCPTCRKESWAELPLRRRPQRPATEGSSQPARQTATSKDANIMPSESERAMVSPDLPIQNSNKAWFGPDATVQDLDRGSHAGNSDAASTASTAASGDHDEEAAVDAMLVSS